MFPGLGETPLSSRTGKGALSQACVGGGALAGWDRAAMITTGAKLFLNRTGEGAAGLPVVDSVTVPVERLQEPMSAIKAGNRRTTRWLGTRKHSCFYFGGSR